MPAKHLDVNLGPGQSDRESHVACSECGRVKPSIGGKWSKVSVVKFAGMHISGWLICSYCRKTR